MEDRKRRGSIKTRRKWKKFQTLSSTSSSKLQHHAHGNNTIFALMLAALSADSNKPIIERCLNQLRLSLLSKTPKQTLPIPILSLLPVLLNNKCAEIVSNCAEIVGAASIFSFEMNEQIASDGEVVKGLVSAVGSTKMNVLMAACNAILDLSTTSIGRQRLLEFSAMESLMWEGFAHTALHHWYQKQNQSDYTSSDSFPWNLNVMSVNLLHVAIMLLGDSDPTFRKACLVSSISFLSDTEGWLDLNQRTIFSHLVNRINRESRFSDAVRRVEVAVQRNEDTLQQIRWLQHLNEGEMTDVHNLNIPSIGMESFFLMCDQHRDKAEAVFVQVKSKFCSEVVFEDVEQNYKMLLEKYKKARKQYMSGMLSLH